MANKKKDSAFTTKRMLEEWNKESRKRIKLKKRKPFEGALK